MKSHNEFKLSELFKERVKGAQKKKGATVLLTFKRLGDVDDFIDWAGRIRRETSQDKEPGFELNQTIKAISILISMAEQNALDQKHFDHVTPELLKETRRQRLAIRRAQEFLEQLQAGVTPELKQSVTTEGKQQGFIGSSYDEPSLDERREVKFERRLGPNI